MLTRQLWLQLVPEVRVLRVPVVVRLPVQQLLVRQLLVLQRLLVLERPQASLQLPERQ